MTRMTRYPLRVLLVAVVVGLSSLGLLVSGVAATQSLQGYLEDRVDEQLVNSLRQPGQLGRALQDGGRRPDAFGLIYVQVAGVSSPLPEDVAPPRIPTAPRANGRPFTVDATSGSTRWRVIETLNTNGDVLAVAVPLDQVQETVRRLVAIEAVVGLIVLGVLGAVAFAVVRRSLQPLVAVEQAAEQVAAGDLTQRVPESDSRTEVGSLAQSFNAMVAQLETAFASTEASEADARRSEDKMRRFVGDASHELRTPLTSIRGFAELYRQGALPAQADVDRAMSRVESEAARMGLLVEDLLLLARLDQQRPLERAPVDLLSLAQDAVADARAVDPSRSIELEVVAAGPPPVVLGDGARLRQVLGNLVGNALTHTESPVSVRLSTVGGAAAVDVVDHGPGIVVEQRDKVFERFYRADDSRTRSSGGTGLGLSIVAALVAAHDGTVDIEDTPGGGATFRVSLPLDRA